MQSKVPYQRRFFSLGGKECQWRGASPTVKARIEHAAGGSAARRSSPLFPAWNGAAKETTNKKGA
jgi:hypothetical protein